MGEYKSRRPMMTLSRAVTDCAVWSASIVIAYFGATLLPDAGWPASGANAGKGAALGALGNAATEEDSAGAAASNVAGAEAVATSCGAFAVSADCACTVSEAPIKAMARAMVVVESFIVG